MKLSMVRHLWGVTDPWESALPRFAARGYDAVESPMPPVDSEARFNRLLGESNLGYVAMAFTEPQGQGVPAHLGSLREQAIRARDTFGAKKITVHGGEDRWPLAVAIEFYRGAVDLEHELGVTFAHETHRGRVLYNPWRTLEVLAGVPQLKLCCDFSHWVVVTERLLTGEMAAISLAAERCVHLHARVGYPQGPQVPDPSVPEYAEALAAHKRWWTTVWTTQQRQGAETLTVTPEFGPPTYMHTDPKTGQAVAGLDEVCEWMTDRIREWFPLR